PAAIAVPPSAATSAITATIIAGLGRLRVILLIFIPLLVCEFRSDVPVLPASAAHPALRRPYPQGSSLPSPRKERGRLPPAPPCSPLWLSRTQPGGDTRARA